MITKQDWENIITLVKEDFMKAKSIKEFNLWISSIKYIGADNSKVIVELPSYFFRDLLIIKGYLTLVQTKILEFTQNKYEFDIRIKGHPML